MAAAAPASPPPTGVPVQAERERAWARLLAARPPAWVPPHCQAVEALALAMCGCAAKQGLEVDATVVACGCLLHDIGRSVTQDVRHAGLGADMLRADAAATGPASPRGAKSDGPPDSMPAATRPAWSEAVVLCVERHTGAGIDAADARALGLPERDYTPRSLEQRIVAHADNLYSGTRRLGLAELRAKYEAKGLPAALAKIERLHAALCDELAVDLERLAPAAPAPLR